MKTLYLVSLAILMSACGSADTAQTQGPSAVTKSFTYAQATQICNALKNWNAAANNIQFPGDPGSVAVYFFSTAGITQNGQTLSSDILNVGTGGTPVCVVTIQGGRMTSVQ